MACRGVHFAITDAQLSKLLAATNDAELLSVVQDDIEERWDEGWLYQTDKAWDAIHRSLTDGKLEFNNGRYPYGLCILGGRQLYSGDHYIVSLKTPAQIADLAAALATVTQEWFRQRYFSIAADYPRPLSDEDFGYTWDWFDGLAAFYQKAASAGRHVIFTVDQ